MPTKKKALFHLPRDILKMAVEEDLFYDFYTYIERFPASCGNFELSLNEENGWIIEDFIEELEDAGRKFSRRLRHELHLGLLAYGILTRLNERVVGRHPCVVHSHPMSNSASWRKITRCTAPEWKHVYEVWQRLKCPIIMQGHNPNTHRWTVTRNVMPNGQWNIKALFDFS